MGLISNELELTREKPIDPAIANGTKVAEAKPVTYDATTRTVDKTNETVSGQLDSILSNGSPLLERARAGATQTANSRGLINSTMAAQAGEAAVIDAALPIANADANVYGTAARDNQSVQNASSAAGADAANRAAAASVSDQNQAGRLQQQGQIERGIQTLRGEQATGLANIEANYKSLLQASDSAARMLTTAQSAIAAIQADINTSAAQKTAAVQKMAQLLESGLAVVGSVANVDLAGLLDFTGA